MKQKKKAKKTARDRGFQGWNEVAVWRDFKPIYIPEDIWPHYLEHVMSEQNSWLGDNAHWRLRSVCCTCKTDGKINLNEIYC